MVAPEPATGLGATIYYRLSASGVTAMRIIDLDGRILQTIQLGSQPAGEHNYRFGMLSKIALGNYILVLEQNSKVVARSPFVIAR